IDRAIRGLEDADFKVRERSTDQLWRLGRPAMDAVRQATKSSDPEVAWRARSVWDKFRIGLLPDTPADIAMVLKDYPDADASQKQAIINRLFEMGPKAHATLATIAANEEDATLKQAITHQLAEHVAEVAPSLLARG